MNIQVILTVGSKSLWAILLIVYVLGSMFEFYLGSSIGSLLAWYTIVIVVSMFAMVIFKKQGLRLDRSIVALVLFITVVLASLLWSQDKGRGLYYVGSICLQGLMCIAVCQFKYTRVLMDRLVSCVAISGCILSVMVLSNRTLYMAYTDRYSIQINDTGLDPNNLALFLVISFAALIFHRSTDKRLLGIRILFLFVIFFAALSTSSRGAVVALVCLTVYMIFTANSYGVSIYKKFLVIAVFGVVSYSIANIYDTSILQNVIHRFMRNETGNLTRPVIWNAAIHSIQSNMMFGSGPGNGAYLIGATSGFTIGSHNTYLTILLEFGLVGITLFGIAMYQLITGGIRHQFHHAIRAMLVVALVGSFFLDTYNKKVLWLPIVLSYMAMRTEDVN